MRLKANLIYYIFIKYNIYLKVNILRFEKVKVS